MSDPVKRWWIPKILYPYYAPVSETDEVVPGAAYDDAVARAEAAEAERDALRMAGVDPRYDAAVSRAEKAEARIHLLQQHLDATTADRNRWSSRAGEAEDRIVDLGNRCIKAEGERDNLRRACDEKEKIGDAFLVRAEKAEAERDGLAEPVEERQGIDCGRPGCSKPGGVLQHHGFGKCVERRGTTRHDARGRRQYDPRVTIYTASDRRRAQRRKA